MAELKSFTCDICQTIKKQTNHWWVVKPFGKGVMITAFDGAAEKEHSPKHACGTTHALQLASQFLAADTTNPVDDVC